MSASALTVEAIPTHSVYYASLVDILAQNYTRAFSAVSYIEISLDGEDAIRVYSAYSEEKNSRSVYEVAKAAYADTEYGYTEAQLSIVKSFIDGVLVLSTADGSIVRIDEVTANGYTSPYTVGYADGVLVVTKSEGVNLKTVILDGKIYTKGWSVSEDDLTVTVSIAVPSAE